MNVSLFLFPRNIKLLMQEFNLKLDKGFMLSVLDFFKQEEILKEVFLVFLLYYLLFLISKMSNLYELWFSLFVWENYK